MLLFLPLKSFSLDVIKIIHLENTEVINQHFRKHKIKTANSILVVMVRMVLNVRKSKTLVSYGCPGALWVIPV